MCATLSCTIVTNFYLKFSTLSFQVLRNVHCKLNLCFTNGSVAPSQLRTPPDINAKSSRGRGNRINGLQQHLRRPVQHGLGREETLVDISDDAVILVPLFTATGTVVMNSTTLADGLMMYVRLDGPPQPRAIFGTCIAYSEGTAIGARVQFPPTPYLLVAKPALLELFDDDQAYFLATEEERPSKRSRARLPEDGGEHAEGKQDVEKGTTTIHLRPGWK